MSAGQRTVPAGLVTALALDVVPLAILVKLDRLDGVSFGFATCDIDITYSGLTYEALAAVQATDITQQTGGGVDSFDISGLLQSDRITEADLRAGLYDGAAITMYLINFLDVASGASVIMRGYVGDVNIEDGKYTAEMRSMAQRLAQNICELTSKTCRIATLGDSRCAPSGLFQDGVTTMATYRFARTVSAVSLDGKTITFSADSHATGYYDYGTVKMTSGLNVNLSREIKSQTLSGGQAVVVLQEPFAFTVSIGNTAQLEAGCDRTFTTCQTKFNNRYNFQGEPFIPPVDLIMQVGKGTT